MPKIHIIVAFGFALSTLASAENLVAPSRPIPLDYFGLHIHRADTTTSWPITRFGSWRLWDAKVAWPYLEPERGHWDFRRLDRIVATAELNHVEVLLPLGLSPKWASARPQERSAYGPSGIGMAAEIVAAGIGESKNQGHKDDFPGYRNPKQSLKKIHRTKLHRSRPFDRPTLFAQKNWRVLAYPAVP